MRSIPPLVRLYFLGAMRRQVHLATLFLGASLFMLPAFVNTFSMGSGAVDQISKDFALIVVGYFTLGMAVLLGSSALPTEREARSLYPLLARPISRQDLLIAQHLAIVCQLALSLSVLGFCTQVALGLMMRRLDWSLWPSLYGSLLQGAIIAALCILLSVRFSAALSGTVGVVVFLFGHLSLDFWRLALPGWGARVVKSMLPDLSALSLKEAVIHGMTVSPLYVGAITCYACGWSLVFLWLAGEAFEEVDL